MTRQPSRWLDLCLPSVDVLLFHPDGDDDALDIIARCRIAGRKVGVIWRQGMALRDILYCLPHVDYVMTLGIAKPGESGQVILPEALTVAKQFAAMSARYGYQTVFDGGVNTNNLYDIPAQHIVSASALLHAKLPWLAALQLAVGKRR